MALQGRPFERIGEEIIATERKMHKLFENEKIIADAQQCLNTNLCGTHAGRSPTAAPLEKRRGSTATQGTISQRHVLDGICFMANVTRAFIGIPHDYLQYTLLCKLLAEF